MTAGTTSATSSASRRCRAQAPRKPPATTPSPPWSDSARPLREAHHAGDHAGSQQRDERRQRRECQHAGIEPNVIHADSPHVSAGRTRMVIHAAATPSTPPPADTMTLSVNGCRTSRPRPAPIAARHRHFALARDAARETEIADIHARDEQQAGDGGHQHEQGAGFTSPVMSEDERHRPHDRRPTLARRAPASTR